MAPAGPLAALPPGRADGGCARTCRRNGLRLPTCAPRTHGPRHVRGVALPALQPGRDPGTTLSLRAANDSTMSRPAGDLTSEHPIFAHERNGQPTNLRDHGPFRGMHPFDDLPALLTETNLTRSIRHLVEIRIMPSRRPLPGAAQRLCWASPRGALLRAEMRCKPRTR
jgi:hypothetical protein